MKYLLKYFSIFLILVFFKGCTGFDDFKKTMSGQKTTNTDEFLIKKKDPLVLPPEYEKLPLPRDKTQTRNKNSVETALGSYKSSSEQKTKSNLENMILKELRKKN